MVVVNPTHNPIGIYARKKIGKARQYGLKLYGYPRYGASPLFFGKGMYGIKTFGTTIYGNILEPFGIYQVRQGENRKITVKEKFYIPNNPRTATQQSWRSNFADAVASWQSLTDDQKKEYNREAKGQQLSGYNLFISQYLRSI